MKPSLEEIFCALSRIKMTTLYSIDASIYLFRGYYSLPDTLIDELGRPANALFGFLNFLADLLHQTRATHLAIAFDESLTSSFRNERFPAYKANRTLPPEDLEYQLRAARMLCNDMGIKTFACERFEADDYLGSIARQVPGNHVVVSADKDLSQLVNECCSVWDFARNKHYDIAGVEEKFGVAPALIPDWLGLVGDSVDNIPGIPGIGPKTASQLLAIGSLATLIKHPEQILDANIRGTKKLVEKMTQFAKQAELSKEIATIYCEIDVPLNAGDYEWDRPDVDELMQIFRGHALSTATTQRFYAKMRR